VKLPRDVAGDDLARALTRLGWRITRRAGSHIRLTHEGPPEQHLTIPAHPALKAGTLAAILAAAAAQMKLTREQLLGLLRL
jgi:predicted RNA binding protein YcfA (HicA-like mRNA interferase family)